MTFTKVLDVHFLGLQAVQFITIFVVFNQIFFPILILVCFVFYNSKFERPLILFAILIMFFHPPTIFILIHFKVIAII